MHNLEHKDLLDARRGQLWKRTAIEENIHGKGQHHREPHEVIAATADSKVVKPF
jgi:hypothetical protein